MKPHNSLIFIIIVLFLLGVVSVVIPREGIDIGIRKLYFPAIEDILFDGKSSKLALEHLQAIEEELRLQRYKDSLNTIYTDSLAGFVSFFENSPARISLPDNDFNFFNDFFAELDSCREHEKIVRIMHYGDSQIEGDRMTGYIRQYLQEKFGGSGPGLLPAVQPIPSISVGQTTSENIERYTIEGMHQNRASHNRYGVLGQFGAAYGDNYVTISARRNALDSVKKIHTVRLFAGRDTNFTTRLALRGQTADKAQIAGTSSTVKVYSWNLPVPISSFSIYTSGVGELYAIAADGNSGIAVDNIPFRGSSGTFFTRLDKNVMTAMLRELNARLIILQFGGNSVPVISGEKSIENLCNIYSRQINFWKEICPEAKIMLIGPSDMSTRVDGQLATYPLLETFIEGMKETAMQNGAAFWNMYEVMGGKNSMIQWVRNSPTLAAPDYVHFTSRGVERIASLLCETFMVYYDYYRFVTNHQNNENNKNNENNNLTCEEISSSE